MSQGKVSMVMPCYNKEHHISMMFDSILAQSWDNVELVLVNDGSTDGTRDVIAAYELQFRARGYEVQVLDQDNAGVCAAARHGLMRITGDYVCLVDSDDELGPEYVSTMAQWLDDNPDCDIAICSAVNFIETNAGREFWHYPPKVLPTNDNDIKAEHFLMGRYVRNTVWVYMLRASYLKQTRITETYFVDTKGSHEPGYVIPLHAYNGKKKLFPLALYKFNSSGDGHSQFKDMEHAQRFYDEYHLLCEYAIDALSDSVVSLSYKRYLKKVSLLSKEIHLYRITRIIETDETTKHVYSNELAQTIEKAFGLDSGIIASNIKGNEDSLMSAVTNCILSEMTELECSAYPELITDRLYG